MNGKQILHQIRTTCSNMDLNRKADSCLFSRLLVLKVIPKNSDNFECAQVQSEAILYFLDSCTYLVFCPSM